MRNNRRLEDLDNVLGKQLEEKANEMAGKVFILSSPKQVRTVLYEALKLGLKVGTMVGKLKEVLSPPVRLSWSSATPCQKSSPSTETWRRK